MREWLLSNWELVSLSAIACFLVWLIFYLRKKSRKYNHVDWGSKSLNFIDGLCRGYCVRFHRLKLEKFDLPEEGGAILISNHVSGVDPLLLIAACDRPIRFMIAKEEYQRFGLKWLFKGAGCIPVDRTGRADIAFRQAKRALDSGDIVALFPHGKIHLDHIEPFRVKPGIKRLAQLTKKRILVARITGVRGQGSVFKPLFLRSQTEVLRFPDLSHEFFHKDDALHDLGELLLGHRHSVD
ncbi:Phospholipid/glycerol acyltransferase [Kangiella sediminilitoris]|uniref:Phospholipid/glycerol acyltransferase n=2 Tax=Kangiella sediminilitoris TaxID=1144748 RepID=A0A1B3BB41_9GAMM|nr:Phospholipid/glycerol acyltransferase [Kangiella sediminilitoris]